MSDRTHYTTAQLAKELKVSPTRVLQLTASRGVAHIGVGPGPGRSLLWPLDAVQRLKPDASKRRKT